MGRFDDSAVEQAYQQSHNPAAPSGLQQQAGGRFSDSKLQPWNREDHQGNSFYVDQSQSWYSGANQQGLQNGWSNGFVDSFTSNWDKALQAGTARTYFEQKDATGVVTWDHQSQDSTKNFHFGDVYENGKFKGNLYDQFDRDTANLMMAPWVLDNDVQARAFSDSNRMQALNHEIGRVRESNKENFDHALTQGEFNASVSKEQKKIQGGWGDEAIAGGGAAGGAAVGAGAGAAVGAAFFGVGAAPGAAVGAGIGALVGGVGAWMNRDSLSQQAARAKEITDLSFKENGFAAGASTWLSQWSQFGGKLITPTNNFGQGLYDVTAGKGGDGQSEFYRMDDQGRSKTPGWMKAADLGTTLADSLLQFASPLGAALYTGQMTGTVAGQVGELALSGGKTFDYQRGGYDNIFRDEHGNFDAGSAAAGIANIGIDAVQLGMARGLMGRANAARAAVGEDAAYKATLGNRLGSRLPIWMGGTRGLADGEKIVHAAGLKFVQDAEGNIVRSGGGRIANFLAGDKGAHLTLGILAPSEQLTTLSSRVLGRRMAAKAEGAYAADDFYRAAHALSAGERRITAALVNGFGEGYEEAAQSFLEPWSHNNRVNMREVLTSAAYGAASGAGMSMGTMAHEPTADEKMFHQARLASLMTRGGADLSRQEWDALSPIEKRQRAALSASVRATAEAAYRKITEDQAREHVAGVAGVNKMADAIAAAKSAALAKGTLRTDGAFVITQIEELPELDADGNLTNGSQVPTNSATASARQTAANLHNHLRGVVIGRATLADQIPDLEAAVAADPADTASAERLLKLQAQVKSADLVLEWGARLDQVVGMYLDRIHDDTATPATVAADVAELNNMFRAAFNKQVDDFAGTPLTEDDKHALAKAATFVFVRDPQDQSGSYQVLVPQVSTRLTMANTDNVLEISHAILPAIRGDYDGDKMRQQAQLILDDAEFTTARSGAHFLGAGASVNVGAPKYEKYVVESLAASFDSGNKTLEGLAEKTLQDIAAAVRKRYTGVVDAGTLDEVLDDFFTQVRANNKDSRAALLDGLATKAGGPVTEFARQNLSNEWLWLDQLIGSTLQRFQESYASHRPELADVNTTDVAPVKQSVNVRTRAQQAAATIGQTMANLLPGDSLFRQFQKLHYTVIGSPVLSAENIEPTTATEMAALYRELGQRVTRSELERIQAADDISGRVYVQLQRLADDLHREKPNLNPHEALVVIANLAVEDIDIAEDGEVTGSGKAISLAQMLLKQSVMQDRREKQAIYDASPELQAKHNRLLSMVRPGNPRGAEQAFVEVVGAQQLYTLLGDQAAIFGAHLTVEQFLREYTSLSETDRTVLVREGLMREPAYLGRHEAKNMPYRLDEVEDNQISPYRSVVDAIISVGNHRISMDNHGTLSGEIAERSDRSGEDFRAAHARVRRALQEFAGLRPGKDGELDTAAVQRLFDEHPDFARQVMDLIPDAAANAAFKVRDNEVFAANWLFTLFTIEDSKEAEMHYYRNLLLAQWNAAGIQQTLEEEGSSDDTARKYHTLKRRMHRIMFKLAAAPDGGLTLQKFINELESATDLTEFIRWVNTEPGIRGEQAPITAWVDDVAEFDADKANGGWTTALPMAELREAMTMLRTSADNLVDQIVTERAARKNDVRTVAAIRRVLDKNAGKAVQLEAGDQAIHDNFVKALRFAAQRKVSLGPQAMLYEVAGAIQTFYESAHTKGKNPGNVAPYGAFEAQRDAFDFVTNYERLMNSLTSVNLDAVGANLGQVAKDAGRTMDDFGREVTWEQPSPEQMLYLLENHRDEALAVLFPQVMERSMDGRLIPKTLVGQSLTELLNGQSMKDLFPRGDGTLAQSSAFKYLSMVEGVARKYGGTFSVTRAINDLVIARTSAADHVLSAAEQESMIARAVHDVAQVLQATGSRMSAPHDPGSDPLAEVLEETRKTRRLHRTARALGMSFEDAEMISDAVLDSFIKGRRADAMAERSAIRDQLSADPANAHLYQRQIEAIENDIDRFETRVDLLRADDTAGMVANMFSSDDWENDAIGQMAVTEYILSHLAMIESATSSTITVSKLLQQLRDPAYGGNPVLSKKEWDELSRAVIGTYLDEVTSVTAPGVSVSPWPDADHESDRRYYDSSYAYLAEGLLKSDGPLAQAARDVHEMADRLGDIPISKDQFLNLLDRTVLDHRELGPWDGNLVRASIAANERLDSAPAESAIAIPGNSPKRLATIMAATRRTFAKPDPALLSHTELSAIDLENKSLFDEVDVTMPDGTHVSRPLAQLNNRFASSVKMQFLDGTTGTMKTVDLLAEPDVGRRWFGAGDPAETVAKSGYREIHLDRIKRAISKVCDSHAADPASASVIVEFFHPDSQPAEKDYYNNIYFEGTSFSLDADEYESLAATLWFAEGGINPANQAAALDASKTGKSALQVIDTVPAAEREALEANWSTDLAAMLRAKTRILLATDLGFGALDAEYFNAVYKDMKLRHFVRTGDGNLLTAEQVIAMQLRGEALPAEATLWVPSDDVLRSLLGEQGTQGVARIFNDQLEVDPSHVPAYQGVSETMLERFKEGIAGQTQELHETRIAQRARTSQLVVRTMLDEKTRNAFDEKMRYFAERRTDIHLDRGEAQRTDGVGFNARTNMARAVEAGSKMLSAEDLSLHWLSMGIPFGPRKADSTILSTMLLRDLAAAQASDGYRTGWIYREGSKAQPMEGLLSEVSLGAESRKAYRVAPGDLVVVELDSFGGDIDLAKRRIEYLAKNGATVLLGATDGSADMRAELSEHLVSDLQYEPIAGSQHAYQPGEFGSRYQNQKARASSLTATRGISAARRIAVFHTTGRHVHENAGMALADNERLGAVAVVANLVPTAAMAGINVPVTKPQIDAVRAHLRGLDNAEGRAHLKDQANGKLQGEARAKADEEFDASFDRLMRRFADHDGTVLPQADDEFGKNDIIPLVDQSGRVILYRHGHKALRRDQINKLAALPLPGRYDAANVAVFPTDLESAASIHTGIVREFRPRAGYGLEVEMDMPLSVFGDKKQLEMNGMKYVISPKPDSVVLPDHGFFPNWGVDLIGSLDDAISKEAVGDQANNHSNAFAYFGIDFLPDATEFFFPGQRDSGDARRQTLEILRLVQTRAPRISVTAAHELITAAHLGSSFAELMPTDLIDTASGVGKDWLGKVADLDPIENKITAAMLVYLMTPGARVEDVLSSGGFNAEGSTDPRMQSREMPRLFTQIFDQAPLGSALRGEINKRLNDQIHNPNTDGSGYVLHEDWTFEIRNKDRSKSMWGRLSFPEAHSAGDNPVKNGMSFDETDTQQVSQHSAAILHGATGGEVGYSGRLQRDGSFEHPLARAQRFADGTGVVDFKSGVLDGGVWSMLTDVNVRTHPNWNHQTPAEAARRDSAREAMKQFRQPIDTNTDAWGTSDKQKAKNQKEYGDLKRRIARRLGLLDAQAETVDFWVRQVLGMPHGQDENGNELGQVTPKGAIEAAKEILDNVTDGYLPTIAAEVPMLHLYDLQMIFRANRNRTQKWAPRDSADSKASRADSWDAWVEVALGSALTSDNLFDPLYLLALDGFMHSYQAATRSLMELPVSMDSLISQQLLDPDLNNMVVSISQDANRLATDPMLLDVVRADVEKLIGGQRIAGKFKGKAAPASEVARRREIRRKWRKENGVPVPLDVTMKNFRKNGAEFVDHSTTTNALIRSMTNLRVGTALINPALYVSMGPEQWIRGTLDSAANLLTGQATSGPLATRLAKMSENLDGTRLGQALSMLGLDYRYTTDELSDLKRLYSVLGSRNDFKKMVYGELMFQRPYAAGVSKVEKALEGYAKLGARVQDPTWGIRADTLARRYMEGALQHILATPTLNVVDVQTLVSQMMTDPEFLKDNYPEAHLAGSNNIAQIRSLKQTPVSLALRGIYEPMANSSKTGTNLFGNLVLKIPMLFSGYAMNVVTSITGLQGLSDMTAMFLDGRAKGPNHIFGRMQAKLAGREFSPEQDAEFDMSSVLEGLDLSRSFIRGALTHAALFQFGLMAGGLGLSGEDDEMKKRRRLSQLQGVGILYDPRSVENDFRNADAIYLDWLPTGLQMRKPHWMLKQFLSPIMGMEKFYETGDFRHVGWGFEDAVGSFPLVNTMGWSDAYETANDLADQADNANKDGTKVGMVAAGAWLTSAVGVYERMLFENSFVNQLYIGKDEYDRDPYVLPLRDSDGTLQRDIEGNARPNDLAMQSFINPETGQVEQGYLGRSDTSAKLHVLTENRASLALVMSLFTGGSNSDYWRSNMPIKTREIDKPDITKKVAEALVRAAATSQAQPRLTEDEIAYLVKGQAMKAQNWDVFNNADKIAHGYASREPAEALSMLDKDGAEVLSKSGARAVYMGLVKGTVKLNDASLAGIHIPFEMRSQIQKEWMHDLVQEGVDLGLDKTKALSRMKRIWYGPTSDPNVQGLGDILWSKDISYQKSVTYGQLNTTYVIGPDGRPWATGFERDKLMGALGLSPLRKQIGAQKGMALDSRNNSVDLVHGMNTGLRGLVPFDDSRNVPTDKEIGDAIIDAIKDAAKSDYTPFAQHKSGSGSGGYHGYHGYRRGGYGGYGGGGGGGGYFTRMNPLPDNVSPYGNSTPFINTSNPIVRRAFIRRERVQSERGRLNQWQ